MQNCRFNETLKSGAIGFEIDGNITRFPFFPQRESVGDNNFYIANVFENL